MKLLSIAAAVLLLSSALGLAAPIDCRHTSTPDERTVCSDPGLIQADARLDTLYQLATRFLAMGQRDDLLDSQRAWIKQRQACGRNKSCLRSSYAKRLASFDEIFKRVESHGPF